MDGWSDKHKKNQYFGVTIHFISIKNGELCMNDRTLLIRELDDAERKDGAYVKKKNRRVFGRVRAVTIHKQYYFRNGQRKQYGHVAAPLQSNSLFCPLNQHTVGKMLKDLPCVKAATAIVAYFKKSGKNKFSTTLKSNVSTRWNSVYYMFDSILKHWEETGDVLRANNAHLDDLNLLCYDELDMLRTFLEEFKKASLELEAHITQHYTWSTLGSEVFCSTCHRK